MSHSSSVAVARSRGLSQVIAPLIAASALLVAVCASFGVLPHGPRGSTILPLVVVIILAFSTVATHLLDQARGRRADWTHTWQRLRELLIDWGPLIGALIVYDNYHDLTARFAPTTLDGVLGALDRRVFGVMPSVWLTRFYHPLVTELMTVCYASLFLVPLFLLTRLSIRNDRARFREVAVSLLLTYSIGLIGYLTIPAIGPRYAFDTSFTEPLVGIWLTVPAAHMWRSLQAIDRDCFPSLHVALSAVSLVYLWRYRAWAGGRVIVAVSAPIIVGLWISTLYLRYHYGVDVLAGFALAGVVTWVAPRLSNPAAEVSRTTSQRRRF